MRSIAWAWSRLTGLIAATAAAALLLAPGPAAAAPPVPGACQDGVLPGGALSRICVPAAGWSGELVIWAHGYIAADEPIDFYHLTVADGTYLPDLVQRLGLAFATTSYRVNGLAILPAIDDVRELVASFPAVAGRSPTRTYLTGASEGGLVTTLAMERHPELFSGGLAACGPIGSFRRQVDYVADFRVLFDYFFPGVIPGSPVEIPAQVLADWDAVYVPAIAGALAANPAAARELMATSGAATDPRDAGSVEGTAVNLLWYNVFGTNDAVAKLGGQPYDNRGRRYRGSSHDLRLNLRVPRFDADPAARAALGAYETSGEVTLPLVTLHTGWDEIVPFWHEQLYQAKARPAGGGSVIGIPVARYGHCIFTRQELLAAFAILRLRTR